jgi:hypothetical protein
VYKEGSNRIEADRKTAHERPPCRLKTSKIYEKCF